MVFFRDFDFFRDFGPLGRATATGGVWGVLGFSRLDVFVGCFGGCNGFIWEGASYGFLSGGLCLD